MNLKVSSTLRTLLSRYLGGYSHEGSRDLYASFGYPRELTPEAFVAMYQRNDLANRIIRAFPSATWREAPMIRDDKGDSAMEGSATFSPFVAAVETLFEKHRILSKLERADRLASIGHYGVLMLGFNDKQKADKPLAPGEAPLTFLSAFPETSVTISQWDMNEKSPRFGKPLSYTVRTGALIGDKTQQVKSINVHYSRIIHIAEFLDEDDTFGLPRLKPIYNRLMDLEKVVGASAETFWVNSRPGIFLNTDADSEFDAEDVAALKAQTDEFEHQLRRIVATRGFTPHPITAQVADPKPNVETLLDIIAGAVGMPKRILIGSERGELSSEQDEVNWAQRIAERRMSFAAPTILRPLVQRLIDTHNLPMPDGEWWAEWSTEESLTAEKQANLGAIRSTTLRNYLTTPGADIVVPLPEFRQDFLGLPPEAEYEDPLLKEDPLLDEDLPEEPVAVEEAPKQVVANMAPKPLYVFRPVVNASDIIDWAKKQGFATCLKPEDMHVTVVYSKANIDWMEASDTFIGSDEKGLLHVKPGGPRVVEALGDNAIVLSFNSWELKWRHEEFRRLGASHDYPDYQPHITLTYNGADLDLDKIEPYQGEIVLGPETFEAIDTEWKATVKENKKPAKRKPAAKKKATAKKAQKKAPRRAAA